MLLSLLGHCTEVDTSRLPARPADRLAELWRPLAWSGAPGTEPERCVRVLRADGTEQPGEDDVVVAASGDVTYPVSQHLTHLAIALGAGSLLMLHAAGLVSPSTARAIGVVAPSGTGKTTFATTLGDRFGYLTDETLAIDPEDGTVRPYPKPLSLAGAGSDGQGSSKTDRSPAELGLTAVTAPVRLGALVLAERTGDTEVLEPISLAEGLELAIPQSSSFFALPHPLARLAEALTLAGGPWRLRFARQDRCRQILDELPDHEGPAVAWTHVPGPGAPRGPEGCPQIRRTPVDAGPLGEEDRFVRAPWDDAVVSEGRVVILFDRQPVILGGVGAALWEACAEPAALPAIIGHVTAALGEHPRARILIEDGIDTLVAQGVLRLV